MSDLAFLPHEQISNQGLISGEFLNRGVESFSEAVKALHAIPYGRNSDRADYSLVLEENCGTCSTKHALVVALAQENGIPVTLNMGLCRLDTSLDQRVAPFLQKVNLEWLPEAHSYCSYQGNRFDITFPEQSPIVKAQILKEYELDPSDIGARKVQLHRDYIESWLDSMGRKDDLESVWKVREEWIAFLGGCDCANS